MKKELVFIIIGIVVGLIVLVSGINYFVGDEILLAPLLKGTVESNALISDETIIIEGIVEELIIDYFDEGRSETEYSIFSQGERYKLNLDNIGMGSLIRGSRVRAVGKLDDSSPYKVLNVESVELLEDAEARGVGEENPNLGEQKTAVILVNSFENPDETITPEEAWDKVFNESNYDAIAPWIREVSYEKAWLTGDVFGWYTLQLPLEELCDPDILREATINIADPDIYFPEYKRILIVIPSAGSGCGWFGLAHSLGMPIFPYESDDGDFFATASTIHGTFHIGGGTGTHELGHNFGLDHANLWVCSEGVIDGFCFSQTYGDIFDIMGESDGQGHFSAVRKHIAGWLNDSNIISLPKGSTGIYTVNKLEGDANGIKTIRLETNAGFDYSIEYRRPIGYDLIVENEYGLGVYDGGVVRLQISAGGGDSQLLDMVPITQTLGDFVLREGETFTDSKNGISITVLDITDEYMEVGIGSSFSCGNGIADTWEDCEGTDLNGDTCESIGYRPGVLGCDSNCEFDVSLCGLQLCAEDHLFIGGNSCEGKFISHSGNGFSKNSFSLSEGFNWNDARYLSTGLVRTDNLNIDFETFSSDTSGQIERIYLPFDTSSIPSDAQVSSANIVLTDFNFFMEDTHPESDDFMVVVPATVENPPFLAFEDFDQFGSIDNPLELSNRVDIGDHIEVAGLNNNFVSFDLNENGFDNVNKNGFSSFGIRTGYDLFEHLPNNGEYTKLSIKFISARDEINPPTLYLSYSVPMCGNSIIETEEQCDDGNLVSGDGCSSICTIESNGGGINPTSPADCESGVGPGGKFASKDKCVTGEN